MTRPGGPGERPGEVLFFDFFVIFQTKARNSCCTDRQELGRRGSRAPEDMSTAAIAARRALQQQRARFLYRKSLRNVLSWAVHRDIFYVEVFFFLPFLLLSSVFFALLFTIFSHTVLRTFVCKVVGNAFPLGYDEGFGCFCIPEVFV